MATGGRRFWKELEAVGGWGKKGADGTIWLDKGQMPALLPPAPCKNVRRTSSLLKL